MKSSSPSIVLRVIFAISVILTAARGSDIYWTNTLGGNWRVPGNWSPNQVPSTNDDVFITQDGTYTVTVDRRQHAAALTVGGSSGVQTVWVKHDPRNYEDYGLVLDAVSLFDTNAVLNVEAGVWGSGRKMLKGVLNLSSGSLIDGPWTIRGTFNWTGGIVGQEGSGYEVDVESNAVVHITGDNYCESFLYGTVNNKGLITCAGSAAFEAGYGGVVAGVLNNCAGGVFDLQEDRPFNAYYGGPAILNNAGTFRKSGGTNSAWFGWRLNNTGTVELQSGTLGFDYVGTLNQTRGATLLKGGSITSLRGEVRIGGGLLGGSGAVTDFCRLRVSGQLSPGLSAGILQTWGYIQSAGGSFNVEIGGVVPGTGFDQLVVTGQALLAGAINICSINGYVPNPGDSFEIMKFSSVSGSVAFNGLDVAKGVRLEPIVTSTNIVLVAASVAPSSAPSLHIAPNGDNLWTWWPVGFSTFTLQSNTNLAPANWQQVTLNELNRYVCGREGQARFFRMVGP
jgi:hypothetical protein